MKKTIALLLAVAMMLGLTACGWGRALTQEEIEDIDFGSVADGVYTNAHFGIGCRPGAGWNVSSQEEIYALNEWDGAGDLREQMKDSLAKPGYFYEMMAEKEDASATVNVCVENVAVMEDPDATPEDYVRSAVVMAREAVSVLELEGTVVEQVERTVAGEAHLGYHMTFHRDGKEIHQECIYIHHGIYVAVITVSCTGGDITGELLDLFYQA